MQVPREIAALMAGPAYQPPTEHDVSREASRAMCRIILHMAPA